MIIFSSCLNPDCSLYGIHRHLSGASALNLQATKDIASVVSLGRLVSDNLLEFFNIKLV